MNGNEFYYSILENNVIYIPRKYKNKGKEYGIVSLNLKQINALAECLDLQSVTPSISLKFSLRIESFLLPRFNEINRMSYTIKPQPTELGVEFSKENLNDILKGLSYATVIKGLKDRGYSLDELTVVLKKVKFEKFK